MKKIFTLFFLLFSVFIFAQEAPLQDKNYQKAKSSFESKNYQYANKLIDKCLKNDVIKSHPDVLLLKSKILFGISQDPKLNANMPSSLKESVKYAEKTISHFKSNTAQAAYIKLHKDFFDELLKTNTEEAVDAYNLKRYSRAIPLFKKTLSFKDDTMSLVFLGDCYWETGKQLESIPYFKMASEKIYKAVLDSNTNVQGYHRVPFRRLGEFYIVRKHLDSAYVVVKNGRSILPNDAILNGFTYALMRNALEKIPPSYDYLKFVQDGLKDFPSDSFLNHRENSIFIFLLNGLAENNEQKLFDSMLNVYANTKPNKAKLQHFDEVKKFDIFAGLSAQEFKLNLIQYYTEINLRKSAYASWLSQFNAENPGLEVSIWHKKIAESILKSNDIRLAEILYIRHLELYPKQKDVLKSMTDFTLLNNKKSLQYLELLPMIRLNDESLLSQSKNPVFKNKNKELRLRMISESSDSGNFDLSRKLWHETKSKYTDVQKNLNVLWTQIVTQDFLANYYGSRVNIGTKTEPNIPNYNWNGHADSCKWGNMPVDVVLAVERRVNYFRRMSGLTEMISMTKQDNELCMFAALMCEANRSMSHSPNEGWRCFIPAGADALSNSILSKDANPSIAVTAAMGQNHATVGNRRWLMFPNAQYMGIGSSKTYTAIKALDNSQYVDTNKYKNQFVAWPPANDCPKMLIFKKWSFSLNTNLAGATVSMKLSNGQAIELKQENIVNGYGMNTIVWEPNMNFNSLDEQVYVIVNIKLKNGKSYSYNVNPIDVKI